MSLVDVDYYIIMLRVKKLGIQINRPLNNNTNIKIMGKIFLQILIVMDLWYT